MMLYPISYPTFSQAFSVHKLPWSSSEIVLSETYTSFFSFPPTKYQSKILKRKGQLVFLDKPIRKMAVSMFIHSFLNCLISAQSFPDTMPGAGGSEHPAFKLGRKTKHNTRQLGYCTGMPLQNTTQKLKSIII